MSLNKGRLLDGAKKTTTNIFQYCNIYSLASGLISMWHRVKDINYISVKLILVRTERERKNLFKTVLKKHTEFEVPSKSIRQQKEFPATENISSHQTYFEGNISPEIT